MLKRILFELDVPICSCAKTSYSFTFTTTELDITCQGCKQKLVVPLKNITADIIVQSEETRIDQPVPGFTGIPLWQRKI